MERTIDYEFETYDFQESSSGESNSVDIDNSNLFNRNIIKRNLLIDTHTMDYNISTPNQYIIDFEKVNNLTDNGVVDSNNINHGSYNNVVGFKLVKAILHNIAYTITSNSNTIYYTDNGDDKEITISPDDYGLYTNNELAYLLSENESISECRYNELTDKFTITFVSSGPINLSTGENNINKLLGFNNSGTVNNDNNIISSVHPSNLNNDYIDLVIDEIPLIACKDNRNNKHIIDRIPINASVNNIIIYEPHYNNNYQNYFIPINLNKVTIEFYDSNNKIFHNHSTNFSLEFELTIIKNFNINKEELDNI